MTSLRNVETVKTQFATLDSFSGNFSQHGMWKVKRKIFPIVSQPPMAKKDKFGNLITSAEPLKQLYLQTYIHRLRNRPMKDDMVELKKLKTDLWEGRLELSKKRKSKPWTLKQLDCVLKSLKYNQSRDPNELLNEVFKPPIVGKDLKLAILYLMNGIKQNLTIPEFMQVSNITTISKPKSSRFDVEGERGIFILSIFRKIFDKLVYNDQYYDIDSSMSDSNIGARKEQNVKNHLFVLYGIINYVLKELNHGVDICIYDIEKCFDSLWLEDVLNDYYDSLPPEKHNDKLALVYEANKNNLVAVKTGVGLTERVNIQNIVTQGGTFGPLECSNSIDKIAQRCSLDENIFVYKKLVKIPPLGYIDDILSVALCGQDSLNLNISLNTQIETKKLRFHTPNADGKSKCHFIHVGKKSHSCPKLQVHDTDIEKVNSDTYLGDIVSYNGKHTETVKARVARGTGIITQIMSMLEKITLGRHYFEAALLLRESMFLSSILINVEVWNRLTDEDMKQLVDLDKSLLRKILNTPFSTPVVSLYLELGCIDIETLIKGRRLVYLHYLAQRKSETMLSRFFMAQWKYPCSGDWTQQVRRDLEEFEIPEDLNYLRSKSAISFKAIVKKKATELAFTKFMTKKMTLSKLTDNTYTSLEMQSYLKSDKFSVSEARMVFSFRTRMAPFRNNYKNLKETVCHLCSMHTDDQKALLQCSIILKHFGPVDITPIFSSNIPKELVHTLMKIIKFRNICL